MQELIIFFENITSLQRSIILVGGITFFWSVESIIPLFKFDYKKFSISRFGDDYMKEFWNLVQGEENTLHRQGKNTL